MGMWPFRRRSNRKNAASGSPIPPAEVHDSGPVDARRDPARQHDGSELALAGPERRRSRRDTKRKSSRESKKLQRRTYSFSPGREVIQTTRNTEPPPVPSLPSTWKGKGRATTQQQDPYVPPRPLRASTQPAEDITHEWQRMPTLHKRSAQEMARRKSSKKRKEDHDRELEIKAMVAFMPAQSTAQTPENGKLHKKESKKMRGDLPANPSSDVSLRMAGSLHSSRSAGSSGKQTSFKLSALDVLSPRPTIRYSENPRYAPGASGLVSERSESRMKRIAERVPVPEGAMKASRRIDELADDLNAGELRELMERDQKRRDKKRLAERIKMEQRIARRQEKQRADEAAAIRDGTPSPPIMDRGVIGREVIGLGIGTSTTITSGKRKNSIGSESGRGKRPAETFRKEESPMDAHNPFADFQRSASLATENLTPASEHSDPLIETAQVGTVAKASVSPPLGPRRHNRGASSISQMTELNKQGPATEAPVPVVVLARPDAARRRSSESSRAPQSWKSFFKLRGARDSTGRGSTPSSFSNTSRDSMHAGLGPQIGYQPMRSTSNLPKRTMSKFREDLPELPISPPQSRVQSPEAEMQPIRYSKRGGRGSLDDPRARYDTPTSGYRSIDAMRLHGETPTSGHRSNIPSPEPTAMLSQSLASIDSEGSWLSGRRAGSKRGSATAPVHHFHDSSDSLTKKYRDLSESAEEEELGIAEDEYFSRLTPGPEEQYRIQRQSTGDPLPSSDSEDGGSIAQSPVVSEKTKWGAVPRHPTVVHREPRVKSREGLLNDFEADSIGEIIRPSVAENEIFGSGPQRATSVDYGKGHARVISGGSARLLDLKPRASGEALD